VADVITALKLQSKNRNRVSIYLDGEYRFSLNRILATGLRVGQRLSDDQIMGLKRQDLEEQTYQRAIRLLRRRPRSEYELRLNFIRHKVPDDVQETVVTRLGEVGLIDDRAFADAWVENRHLFRPRGVRALRAELRKKGVSSEVIEAALQDYDDEQAAYQAAVKGARRLKGTSWDVFRQRLGAYLARRGFDFSTISPVVSRVWREKAGVEDESEVVK
jgi:regulatory protein